MCGFVLAVAIPAASAKKGHNTYTQYCEDGTNTVYSEYNEYCSTTTTGAPVTTGTATTIATSPGTTPLTTPSTTTATPAVTTVSPDVLISGTIRLIASKLYLKVGAVPGVPGLSVTKITNRFIYFNDGGTLFAVPVGAQVAVDPITGVFIVTFRGKTVGSGLVPLQREVKAAIAKNLNQYVVMPKGRTSNQVFYVLPKGIGFPKHTTWAQIRAAVKIYAVTNLKTLRVARIPLKTVVTITKSAANKGRWAYTLKTPTFLSAYEVVTNTSKLVYSKSDKALIAAGQKSFTGKIAIKSKTATSPIVKDHFTFTYTG